MNRNEHKFNMEISTWILLIIGLMTLYFVFKRRGNQSTYEDDEDSFEFKQLHHLISESSGEWDVIKDTPEVKAFKKQMDNSPIAVIKARILIPSTKTDYVFTALWDEKTRQSWDEVIRNLHVIETISDTCDVIYQYVESPVPYIVSNRDFVQKRSYRKVGENYEIIYKSINKDDKPTPEGWVRAHTIMSGYLVTQCGPDVYLDFLSQNDPKGKIPIKLINAFAPQKALDWVKKLRNACKPIDPNTPA